MNHLFYLFQHTSTRMIKLKSKETIFPSIVPEPLSIPVTMKSYSKRLFFSQEKREESSDEKDNSRSSLITIHKNW